MLADQPTQGELTSSIAMNAAALELEKVEKHMKTLFERDSAFYAALDRSDPIMTGPSRVPLQMKPGVRPDNYCRVNTKKDEPVDYTWRG